MATASISSPPTSAKPQMNASSLIAESVPVVAPDCVDNSLIQSSGSNCPYFGTQTNLTKWAVITVSIGNSILRAMITQSFKSPE